MQIPSRMARATEPFKTELFDLKNDPGQLSSITDEAVESRMIGLLTAALQRSDAPAEQYERLQLV